MPLSLDVRIDHRAVEYLNELAKLETRQSLVDFGKDLLGEASRLEANRNPSGSTPEITSSIIKDARLFLRGGYVRRRPPKWEFFVRLMGISGALITGVLTQYLDEPWGPVAVIIAAVVTVMVEAWLLMREYYS